MNHNHVKEALSDIHNTCANYFTSEMQPSPTKGFHSKDKETLSNILSHCMTIYELIFPPLIFIAKEFEIPHRDTTTLVFVPPNKETNVEIDVSNMEIRSIIEEIFDEIEEKTSPFGIDINDLYANSTEEMLRNETTDIAFLLLSITMKLRKLWNIYHINHPTF